MDSRQVRAVERLLSSRGHDPAAAEVYAWLVHHNDASTAEVAQQTRMTERRAEQLLQVLHEVFLCRQGSTPDRHRVVNPQTVLASWLNEVDAQAMTALEAARDARADADLVVDLLPTSDAVTSKSDLVELDDPQAVVTTLEDLLATSRQLVTVVPFAPSAEQLREALPHDRLLLQNNCDARVIYPTTTRRDPDAMGAVRDLLNAGARIRFHPDPRLHLTLVDGKTALLDRDAHENDPGAVVVAIPGVTRALSHVFEVLWDESDPMERGVSSQLSTTHLKVLRLLLEGLKDDGIARRVDLSVRSVRRIIAEMSEVAGAHGRFALGARAVQLGWFNRRPSPDAETRTDA